MSRIGTKKPPIKNAYYAPQEHVPTMHGNSKAGPFHMPNWMEKDSKHLTIEKD